LSTWYAQRANNRRIVLNDGQAHRLSELLTEDDLLLHLARTSQFTIYPADELKATIYAGTPCDLEWADGSGGTFTVTAFDATHQKVDSWTATHTNSDKTISYAATLPRDAEGYAADKPTFTIN
jgi:hypothetical protein